MDRSEQLLLDIRDTWAGATRLLAHLGALVEELEASPQGHAYPNIAERIATARTVLGAMPRSLVADAARAHVLLMREINDGPKIR